MIKKLFRKVSNSVTDKAISLNHISMISEMKAASPDCSHVMSELVKRAMEGLKLMFYFYIFPSRVFTTALPHRRNSSLSG